MGPQSISLASAEPPQRLVARHTAAALIRSALHWRDACDGDLLGGVIFRTIAVANLDRRVWMSPAADGLLADRASDRTLRPISHLAIAQSLNIPYETVRGSVARLTERGYCVRVKGGVVVPDDIFDRPRIASALDKCIDDFFAAIAGLEAIGLTFSPDVRAMRQSPTMRPDGTIALQILAFGIGVSDRIYLRFGDFTRGIVFYAIMERNVRHMLVDASLAWRYAHLDAVPPDDQRIPTSIRAVARDLDLPFETVRRHAAALIADGAVVADADSGLITPRSVIEGADEIAHNVMLGRRFMRTIAAMADGQTEQGQLRYGPASIPDMSIGQSTST